MMLLKRLILTVALTLFFAGSCQAAASQKPQFRLSSFGALPVLEGGRIKPMDTVARSTLLLLSGKQELRLANGTKMSGIKWLLTTMTQPDIADALAPFRITHPGIRALMGKSNEKAKYFSFNDIIPHIEPIHLQAQQARQTDSHQRSAYQRAIINLDDRITIYLQLKNTLQAEGQAVEMDLARYRESIQTALPLLMKHLNDPENVPRTEEMANLLVFFGSFQQMAQASFMHVVPPLENPQIKENWLTLGDALLELLHNDSLNPAAEAYITLVSSWKNGDAATFNQTVTPYLSFLRETMPDIMRKTDIEAGFNRIRPFYISILIYLTSFLLIFVSWLFNKPKLEKTSFVLAWVGFALHTGGLLIRMWLQDRPPVTNLYSSAVFVGWVSILIGLILETWHRNGIGTMVSAIIGFFTLIIAHHLSLQGDTLEMMQAVLDSNFWLATHVVVINIGYGAAILSGVLAHLYLLRGIFGRTLTAPLRLTLNRMVYASVCFALFFSFTGTVLGGIWADQSWGRFWGWDPKENGALLIVLWLSIILHARWGGLIRERGLMIMSVFTNVVVAFAWFGVNMLGVGLHSYGFMDQAFLWLILFIFAEMFIIWLGFLPLNYWKSFKNSD